MITDPVSYLRNCLIVSLRPPEESLERMVKQIRKINPGVSREAIRQFLK